MGERLLAMVAVWLLSPLHALADRLAYSKIRAGLGVQKAIVSGGGALPPLTDDWCAGNAFPHAFSTDG